MLIVSMIVKFASFVKKGSGQKLDILPRKGKNGQIVFNIVLDSCKTVERHRLDLMNELQPMGRKSITLGETILDFLFQVVRNRIKKPKFG